MQAVKEARAAYQQEQRRLLAELAQRRAELLRLSDVVGD